MAGEAVPEPVKWLGRVSKELMEAFMGLRASAQKPVRLSRREKRLALVVAYASVGCVKCLVGCLKEGMREGISLEELLEAASLSVLVRGAEGVMTVNEALKLLTNT